MIPACLSFNRQPHFDGTLLSLGVLLIPFALSEDLTFDGKIRLTVPNVIDDLLETLVFGDPRRRNHQPPLAFLPSTFSSPSSQQR
jgi:hypothetical protein